MSLPPRLPKAQQDLYAIVPVEWAWVSPGTLRGARSQAFLALMRQGFVQHRFVTEGHAEWRRTPQEDA